MGDKKPELYKDKVDLTHFNKILQDVSKTEERPYARYGLTTSRTLGGDSYTIEDVQNAAANLSIVEMRRMSRYFYNTRTSYRRIIDHFAQAYKYYYTLDLRHISEAKSKKTVLKLYNETLDYLDKLNVRDVFGYISQRVLVDGAFFGYVNDFDDDRTTITQLNPNYCRSRDTSAYGTATVEFNVQFFAQYAGNEDDMARALKSVPKDVRRYWNLYRKGKVTDSWVMLPVEKSCAFFMGDGGGDRGLAPPIIFDTITDIMNFGDYKNIEKTRDSAELEKLLIQQFKLDDDGDLDVLMEEMAGLHRAVSNMLADHDNIDVLTTIADTVDLKDTQSSVTRSGESNINKMLIPKYENAGLSSEIFYATGATTLEYSVLNATSFMSQLVDKYSTWLSMLCLSHFSYGKLLPIVTILPVTWYNQSKMVDLYLKNAQYGFSWKLPYVASGQKQSTMLDASYLEQEVLKLPDVMRPLSSSFTQTDNDGGGSVPAKSTEPPGEPGRPEKAPEDKSPKTIANINAMH